MRYVQDPKTLKLVPAAEYCRSPSASSPSIQGDLEPFQSHVDGSVISSRRDLRNHNARHGVVTAAELGKEGEESKRKREDLFQGRPHDRARRLDAMRFAWDVESRGDLTPADKKQMIENYRDR